MDKLRISGGGPLDGEVTVSGAKNAALPIMCAALLTPKPLALSNVPRLMDVSTMAKLMGRMGVAVERSGDSMQLSAAKIEDPTAPYELVRTMRASVLVLGPLLTRQGVAAGRLRHRTASGRPAREGTPGHGRVDRDRARLHARRGSERRPRPPGRAHRHGSRYRDRDREPDDGGDPGRGHHADRERRARARSGRPREMPDGDGREDRRRRHPGHPR